MQSLRCFGQPYWRHPVLLLLALAAASAAEAQTAPKPAAAPAAPILRAPAVPLVAYDPYFSIWSPADRLTDAATVHWTGRTQPMTSFIRVDGETFRLMGPTPADTAALNQRSVTISATRTTYVFGNARIRVTLSFLTPSLPADLDLLSRPVTYLTWTVASADGKPHKVQVYFDCGAEIAVNTPDQSAGLDYPQVAGLLAARVGTPDQPVLARKGDDVRIDWGYGYLATPSDAGAVVSGGNGGRMRRAFTTDGTIAAPDRAYCRPPGDRVAPGDGRGVGLRRRRSRRRSRVSRCSPTTTSSRSGTSGRTSGRTGGGTARRSNRC